MIRGPFTCSGVRSQGDYYVFITQWKALEPLQASAKFAWSRPCCLKDIVGEVGRWTPHFNFGIARKGSQFYTPRVSKTTRTIQVRTSTNPTDAPSSPSFGWGTRPCIFGRSCGTCVSYHCRGAIDKCRSWRFLFRVRQPGWHQGCASARSTKTRHMGRTSAQEISPVLTRIK
ncbi:hypothetical protein BC826DRAFT_709358 [Russula brevipes]|nr:hypothetical protein BC826DRAFT_709358 [Russula brevipes]